MKIESKEVVILTDEEKKMIDDTYMLMREIFEKSNDRNLYGIAQYITDFIDEFRQYNRLDVDK